MAKRTTKPKSKPAKKKTTRKAKASKRKTRRPNSRQDANPGKRKDGKPLADKASADEIEQRVDECMIMMASGKTRSEIKRIMSERHDIARDTVARYYMPKARKQLVETAGVDRDELRAGSLAFYRSVIASDTASTIEKLRAQRQLDRLMGLPVPVRVDITSGGKEVKGYIGINLDDV
jgi:hypothetical protein